MALSAEPFYLFLERGPLASGDLDKVRQELEQCPKVRCPVLAVWGENDEFLPPHRSAVFLKGCLRRAGHADATFRIMPGATHILTRGEGDDKFVDGFLGMLSDWLRKRFPPLPGESRPVTTRTAA
jgi:pimeloyl-ACP methyl ester carboxylesterase